MKTSNDAMREAVRTRYAALARQEVGGCGTACCTPADTGISTDMIGDAYDAVEGTVADADLRLGCGVPTKHAGLAPGQTVVDLGAGAGMDAFVARHIVGAEGRVLGVDFAPAMVAKARANAEAHGFNNVSFVEGDIEAIPLDTNTADVVLSNCVLNLVPDKAQAFAEMYRILRPGGHFTVSDIVTEGQLPAPVRRSAELYVGCVAGALEEATYLHGIEAAGFVDVEVRTRREIEIPPEALSADLSPLDQAAYDRASLWSITVRGTKPLRA